MSIRPLLIAEAANPEWTSVPLVGWSLAEAILSETGGHLVTHVRNREAILRKGLKEGTDFTVLDNEAIASPAWKFTDFAMKKLKMGYTVSQVTALAPYLYFEYLLWRRFESELKSGKYDLVHRITPLSPTTPSLIAGKLEKLKIPFVLGPLNGGVPWPPGFGDVRKKEGEWLASFRNAYKLAPFYASTRSSAAAIIAGSKYTLGELPAAEQERSFLIPENAIDPRRFPLPTPIEPRMPLKAVFMGRLVPYKGADILIESAAPFLESGQLELDIVGDGPELGSLKALVERLGLQRSVKFSGWVAHEELQSHLKGVELLLFPSIREFGGGVILEAMALGIVPVVADYAGPSELVTDDTGFRVPFTKRDDLLSNFTRTIQGIVSDPSQLCKMSVAAQKRVHEHYTWKKKAEQVMQVYAYVTKRSEKPIFDFS